MTILAATLAIKALAYGFGLAIALSPLAALVGLVLMDTVFNTDNL